MKKPSLATGGGGRAGPSPAPAPAVAKPEKPTVSSKTDKALPEPSTATTRKGGKEPIQPAATGIAPIATVTPDAAAPKIDAVALVPDMSELRTVLIENTEKDGFQVNLFVEKLLKPLLDPEGSKPGRVVRGTEFGFDPSALHDLFTGTLDRLAKLEKEVDERIATIQDESSRHAPQRRKEIERHHKSLNEVQVTIEDIETHFRRVGLTAVRIGQSLSQTEFQRKKAADAQRLLEFFLAFQSLKHENLIKDAETERIELLSNETLGALVDDRNYNEAAEVLADLNVLCEDLNAPHLENGVKNVRAFSERLERKLLERFEAAAMADSGTPNVAAMKEAVGCLLKFGDAVKLYNTYIYTIVAKQIRTIKRSDSNSGDADEMRDALSEYFGVISSLCERAFTLIRQVFPPSSALRVTRMLIDRLVNDSAFGIQVKLAQVLDPDGTAAQGQAAGPPMGAKETMSVSDSLDMLLMVHDKTQALAGTLIDHCQKAEQSYLEHVGRRGAVQSPGSPGLYDDDMMMMGQDADDLDGRGSPKATQQADASSSSLSPRLASRSQEALSVYVKTLFGELFVGQRASYLEKELWLLRFRLLDTLNGVSADVGLTASQERKPKRLLKKRGNDDKPPDLPALAILKINSYEVMVQNWMRKEVLIGFLEFVREAISRNAKMFRKDDERADNVLEILALVHNFLATSVLLPTLSAASNIVQNPAAAGTPPPNFYVICAQVHTWIALYKDFFKTVGLPEVASKTTTQTVLLESFRKLLVRVERAGSKTLEKGIDAVMRVSERVHREMLLVNDYMPRDNTVAELQPTKACVTLKEVISQQIELLKKHLPPSDSKALITALALKIQEFLLSRIKQVRISTSGGLILMQDVEIVYGCFQGLDSPEIKNAFDELKEVVGLFIVPPENLKGLLEHGHLANMGRVEQYYYVASRVDFRLHGMRAPYVRALFGDEGEEGGSPVRPPPPPSRQAAAKIKSPEK